MYDTDTFDSTAVEDAPVTFSGTPSDAAVEEAPVEAQSEAEVEVPAEPKRKTRDLETDLKTILDGLVTGSMQLPEGKKATPHVLAKLVQGIRGGDPGDLPSSGAVSAALNRWETIGYIELGQDPARFVDYTEAGRTEGLAALKRAHRERLAANRAKAKADLVAKTEEVEPEQPAAPEVDSNPPF